MQYLLTPLHGYEDKFYIIVQALLSGYSVHHTEVQMERKIWYLLADIFYPQFVQNVDSLKSPFQSVVLRYIRKLIMPFEGVDYHNKSYWQNMKFLLADYVRNTAYYQESVRYIECEREGPIGLMNFFSQYFGSSVDSVEVMIDDQDRLKFKHDLASRKKSAIEFESKYFHSIIHGFELFPRSGSVHHVYEKGTLFYYWYTKTKTESKADHFTLEDKFKTEIGMLSRNQICTSDSLQAEYFHSWLSQNAPISDDMMASDSVLDLFKLDGANSSPENWHDSHFGSFLSQWIRAHRPSFWHKSYHTLIVELCIKRDCPEKVMQDLIDAVLSSEFSHLSQAVPLKSHSEAKNAYWIHQYALLLDLVSIPEDWLRVSCYQARASLLKEKMQISLLKKWSSLDGKRHAYLQDVLQHINIFQDSFLKYWLNNILIQKNIYDFERNDFINSYYRLIKRDPFYSHFLDSLFACDLNEKHILQGYDAVLGSYSAYFEISDFLEGHSLYIDKIYDLFERCDLNGLGLISVLLKHKVQPALWAYKPAKFFTYILQYKDYQIEEILEACLSHVPSRLKQQPFVDGLTMLDAITRQSDPFLLKIYHAQCMCNLSVSQLQQPALRGMLGLSFLAQTGFMASLRRILDSFDEGMRLLARHISRSVFPRRQRVVVPEIIPEETIEEQDIVLVRKNTFIFTADSSVSTSKTVSDVSERKQKKPTRTLPFSCKIW